MAAITSLGVGSGLDLNTIVTQLVALERQPLRTMQNRATELNSQVSLYGKISSLFSGLQDAANKLTSPTFWQKTSVSSGDTNTVSASAGSTAAAGNYSVTVQALANNQTAVSANAESSSSALVGKGTLRLQVGSWNAAADPPVFTAKADSTEKTIEVTDTDTLATLRDKINAADAGVTAALVTDATGVRLSLRSADSGVDNGFRAGVTDDDGSIADSSGLSRYAYDPGTGTVGMTQRQAGTNARATVNGIAVESASNEIAGAVEGLTLTVAKENATAVNITVATDRAAIVAGIKSFADAYNALASFLSEQTKYDATARTGGPLQGDSAATSLQTQLRSVLNSVSGASSTFKRLSDIGLQSQRDGTLVVNQTKLDTAANNLPELKKAFANSDAAASTNNGFARRYATLASQALAVDGTVTTKTQGLQKLLSKNSDEQTRLNDRVDQFQQRLVAQYTALDSNVARLNALSSYVTQQIAQMNKTTS